MAPGYDIPTGHSKAALMVDASNIAKSFGIDTNHTVTSALIDGKTVRIQFYDYDTAVCKKRDRILYLAGGGYKHAIEVPAGDPIYVKYELNYETYGGYYNYYSDCSGLAAFLPEKDKNYNMRLTMYKQDIPGQTIKLEYCRVTINESSADGEDIRPAILVHPPRTCINKVNN